MQPGFFDYQDRLELLERFAQATQPPARERRIKAEEVLEDWPHNKRRQKDTQAHWIKKHVKYHLVTSPSCCKGLQPMSTSERH